MPLRAADSAVTCAANGVLLREPLKPTAPALSQAMTLPSLSVSVTRVLLNDVLICAWPMAMFLRTLRRWRPLALYGLLGTLARAGVGLGALAVDRHAAAMADTAVAADVHEPLDVLRALAAKVAFDGNRPVDGLAQAHDFFFGQVADLGIGIDAQGREDGVRGRPAHAVDVGETDLDPLLRRDVDARDSCHSLPLPLPVTRVGADHLDDTVPPDDLALLADRLY